VVDVPITRKQRTYTVGIVVPSTWQVDNNCDACRGKHSTRNKKCSANKTHGRRNFRKYRLLDLKTLAVLPFKCKLSDECVGPRKKVGSAILTLM
jgi:hypothetical protein